MIVVHMLYIHVCMQPDTCLECIFISCWHFFERCWWVSTGRWQLPCECHLCRHNW